MSTEIRERKYRIGATDAAAILGVSPYKTPMDLWLLKRGEVDPEPMSEPARWGLALEDAIAARYVEETGREIWRPKKCADCGAFAWIATTRVVAQCPRCRLEWNPREGSVEREPGSWCMAKPDAVVAPEEMPDEEALISCAFAERGVDFKNVSSRAAIYWGESGSEDVPVDYFVQAQWCMLVTGAENWDLAALFGGSEFGIYPIEARPKLQERIFSICQEFLQKSLIGGERPVFDHGDAVRRWIHAAHPRNLGVLREATSEEMQFADWLRQEIVAAKLTDRRIEALKNTLKDAIGDADGIRIGGEKITWRAPKASAKTDWEAVAGFFAAALDAAGKDSGAIMTQAVRALTTTDEPTRRFLTPQSWTAELRSTKTLEAAVSAAESKS